MVEVDYSPLYKFDPEVVQLAKRIPIIQQILLYLERNKVPIYRKWVGGGAYLSIQHYDKTLEIWINPHMKPIDVLASLVHEYYHIILSEEGSHAIYRSKNYYLTYMLNQEVQCFNKQAEFLLDYNKLAAPNNSDWLRLVVNYKRETMEEYVKGPNFDFKELGTRYIDHYDHEFSRLQESVLQYPNWVINNEARIPSCA